MKTAINIFIKLFLVLAALPWVSGCINNNDAALVVQQLQAPMNLRPNISALMINETVRFFAEGGVPPYQYKITTGGGTLDLVTGIFTAPPTPQMVTLEITDANNQLLTKNIQIVDQLKISSPSSYIIETTTTTFSATGGQPPYAYSIIMGDGTIDPISGVFVAPDSASSTIVQVIDSHGYADTKLITIIPRITISPTTGNYPINSKILFSAFGGQPPISFSISSGNASIDATTGILTFGSTPSTVTVVATDSLGFTSEVDLNSFYGKLVSTGGKDTPFTCGINIYGQVQCWGYGFYLGYENVYWGQDNTQLGANLLSKTINNFGGVSVIDVTNYSERFWNTALRTTDYEHACALLSDNSIRCWGDNPNKALGTGNYTNYWVGPDKPDLPIINLSLPIAVNVTKVVVGAASRFTCAILSDNTVKCWGKNNNYQVNNSSTTDMNPVSMSLGTGVLVADIKLGESHACILTVDKKVKCWGNNAFGQLGISQPGTTYGGPNQMGDNLPFLNFGTTVEEISLGRHHSCARLTDGSIKCWGYNLYGQLGLGSTTNYGNNFTFDLSTHPAVNLGTNIGTGQPYKAHRIFAFGYRTCALLEDGALKCWGNNSEVLGIEKSNTSPYDKIGDQPNEVDTNLSLVNLGSNVTFLDLNGYYELNTGASVTCALLRDQTDLKQKIKCWGKNTYGELGYGLPPNGSTNTIIGDQVGEMGDALAFVDTGAEVLKTSLGPFFSCALLTDNQIHCWGQTTDTNGHGGPHKADQPSEFGPFSPTVDLGTSARVVNIQTKRFTTCAIFEDGTGKCWGQNTNGQLGLGDQFPRGNRKDSMNINLPFLDLGAGFKIKSVAMGSSHICALSDLGKIKCWGAGANGRLGTGSINDLGDNPGEMGDALPYLNLGTDGAGNPLVATKITAGDTFSCALLNNQKAKCWGRNVNGELGLDTGYDSTNPDIGNVASEMGDNLKYVDLGASNIIDIASGFNHTCAILTDFSLKCWGNNLNGQLGYEDTSPRGKAINSMLNLQPINLGTDAKALSVFAGPFSTCVVMVDGKLKCFGFNNFGQTGLESNLANGYTTTLLAYNIGDNFNEMGDNLPYVDLGTGLNAYFVSAEEYHTCAVLTNGEVKCWGLNNFGGLGYGDTKNRGNSLNTMGDLLNQLFF